MFQVFEKLLKTALTFNHFHLTNTQSYLHFYLIVVIC
jgi:hypothetical protein